MGTGAGRLIQIYEIFTEKVPHGDELRQGMTGTAGEVSLSGVPFAGKSPRDGRAEPQTQWRPIAFTLTDGGWHSGSGSRQVEYLLKTGGIFNQDRWKFSPENTGDSTCFHFAQNGVFSAFNAVSVDVRKMRTYKIMRPLVTLCLRKETLPTETRGLYSFAFLHAGSCCCFSTDAQTLCVLRNEVPF